MRWVMRLGSRVGLWSVLAASAMPASPVWAEPPGKDEPPETHADRGADPVLSGPRAVEGVQRRSLIARDFDGKIKRLEIPAEEAALELVDLDAATRARIDAILAQRAALLDKLVADNLLKLLDVYNATQAGRKDEAREIFMEVLEQAGPLKERGKLGDEVRAEMTPDQSAAYDRIRREYWEAIIREDVQASRSASGGELARGAVQAAIGKEVALVIGAEIKRSYERQATARADQLKQFVEALALSPEQEAKVTRILADDFQMIQANKVPGKRTTVQGLALVRAIAAELTPEQRVALGTYIRERQGK